MVPLPLRYTEKILGSVSQKRLLSNLWLSRLHFYPAAALEIAHLPTGNHIMLNHRRLAFYEHALRSLADNFSIQRLDAAPRRLKKTSSCSSQEN